MNYNFLFHLHTSDTAIHPSFMIWRCRRWAGYIYLLRRTPVRLDMKVAKVAICFKKRPRLRIAEAKKTTCKKDLKEESCWQKPKVFGFYIYKMFELGVSLKNWLTHQYLHPRPVTPSAKIAKKLLVNVMPAAEWHGYTHGVSFVVWNSHFKSCEAEEPTLKTVVYIFGSTPEIHGQQ